MTAVCWYLPLGLDQVRAHPMPRPLCRRTSVMRIKLTVAEYLVGASGTLSHRRRHELALTRANSFVYPFELGAAPAGYGCPAFRLVGLSAASEVIGANLLSIITQA